MIKLKKNKLSRLDKLQIFINNWKLLGKELSFNWGFIKYLWRISILNNYDVIRLKNSHIITALLLIKKYKAEAYIKIENIVIDHKTDLSVNALQKIKKKIEAYRALGYDYVEVTLPKYEKYKLCLFEQELGFEENKSKILKNIIQHNNTDYISVTKHLRNE